MRSSGFSAAEKSAVTAACQHLIDDFLKPRFLPTIRPTQFNYPVDIQGKWHGTKYRFIQRYRSASRRISGKRSEPSLASTGSAVTASISSGTVTPENGSAGIAALPSPKRSTR